MRSTFIWKLVYKPLKRTETREEVCAKLHFKQGWSCKRYRNKAEMRKTQEHYPTGCSCVNGRACARNNGRRQRTILRSRWHSLELFLTALIFPGAKKRRYVFVFPHFCWHLLACPIGRRWPYFINDGCYHCAQCMLQISTSCVNAIVCPSRTSWHTLGVCPPVPCLV